MPRDPLSYRNPALVIAVAGYIADTGDERASWHELVDTFHDTDYEARTIEAVIWDLIAYGAVQRLGQPGTVHKPDTRQLRLTTLGRHWLEQKAPPPLPGAERDPAS